MLITNPKRKKQIKKFIDKDHQVMKEYYDLLESDIGAKKYEQKMKALIEKDSSFYDPYQFVIDILYAQDKDQEAEILLTKAFQQAVSQIADNQGNWPKVMRWGYLENRHLMRIIERYAVFCWEKGKIEDALDIFRRLLHCNPGDNQGARYNILAIKMNLDLCEWSKDFEVKEKGQIIGLDAVKVSDWFDKNARKFPEEFDWLFKEWEKEEY